MSRAGDSELRSAAVRLSVQFTAIILVLFAILGVVVYTIVATSQEAAAQRTVVDACMIDSPRDAPPSVVATIIMDGSTQSSPNLPKGLPDQAAIDRVTASGGAEQSMQTLDGRSYLVRTEAHDGRVVQVAYDTHEQQEELQRLMLALVVSGVLAAAAGAAVAVVIARRAMRPLAEALALQRRFVADASHELRTPLTLLSTRAQLVRRRLRDATPAERDDVAIADGIDEIVDDSRALGEIVEDLLIAADPREAADPEPVDLVEVAEAAVRTIRPMATERGLQVRVDAGDPVVVAGSPVSVRRLVLALLDNAADHAATAIGVEVGGDAKWAVLRVSDDGPGFPEGASDRAFERFASTRVDTVGSPASRHYGLGLALVSEVVARHGGTVRAENDTVAGGASVTVRLPKDALRRIGARP
ncbi:sensor histidine kinase [Leifsonia poae]|uniref:sensor histidine kinase n=1 Tax=Leifsonia poae TaxID=110933 RepID=UPI001CBEB05C|nr:HAMP domain-containing sensor histidine kinase [Leifsonia poae]